MPVLTVDRVAEVLHQGSSARVNINVAPRFKPGDKIITRTITPAHHTRLPRYARGKHGIIRRDYGVFIFPDSHASCGKTNPQHVYSVRFSARELWGDNSPATPNTAIYIDLWDDYLDLALSP